MAWRLARRLRSFGLRLLCYSDDWVFWVNPTIANEVATFVESEFKLHGFVVAPQKTVGGPGVRKTVAVKVLRPNVGGRFRHDLSDFMFAARKIEAISVEARRRRPTVAQRRARVRRERGARSRPELLLLRALLLLASIAAGSCASSVTC